MLLQQCAVICRLQRSNAVYDVLCDTSSLFRTKHSLSWCWSNQTCAQWGTVRFCVQVDDLTMRWTRGQSNSLLGLIVPALSLCFFLCSCQSSIESPVLCSTVCSRLPVCPLEDNSTVQGISISLSPSAHHRADASLKHSVSVGLPICHLSVLPSVCMVVNRSINCLRANASAQHSLHNTSCLQQPSLDP